MDYFLRQRTVPDWHQPLIETQRALVLGVGGIGCTVAREVCRLGVCELVLVDNDVVSVSNLNRQVLYCVEDVGRNKAAAAVDGLLRDNIHTRVTGVHCDAVKEWKQVVQLAKNATVVFNCIDYGEYFDCAVMSLCVSLGLPYLTASSYGHTGIAECYPSVDAPQRGPCWVCNNAPARGELVDKITPDKICGLYSIDFLPQDSYMPSTQEIGSSVLTCSLGATLMTGAWLNSLHGYSVPNWISCDFAMFQLFSYHSEHNSQCLVCQRAPRYSPQTLDIYFGTEVVKLSPVAGETLPYSPGSITNPVSESHMEVAKSRLKSVCNHGDMAIYLPAIPAAQLDLSDRASEASLPTTLQRPLVKSKEGPVTAIRSGGRSCIVPLADGCYRLKGCGNYVDAEGMRHTHPGFPLVKMEVKGHEIRGCCFEHTALTEQYISHLVGELLLESGIAIGNKPVGLWKYNIPEDPLPAVTKYCGVFETLGERRAGTHLIHGLEELITHIFPNVTQNELWSLFPADRLVAKGEVKPTWSACCSGSFKNAPVDVSEVRLPEISPGGSPPHALPCHFLGAWFQSAYKLRQSLSREDTPTIGSLMALVYRRVGWEMGVVKRTLERHRINWGYFIDHNPFEPHCNAHPNNFIVLPPGHESLLAPVDFDLSFEEAGFFSPYSGSHDPSLFESWLLSENVELERGVAGEKANTGVDMSDMQEMSLEHRGLCWAFRDTLLLGYRAGYAGVDKVCIHDNLRPCVDALIQMALLLTHSANS